MEAEKPCLGVSHVDPSIPRRRSVGSSVDPVDLRETPRFEPSEEVIGITDPLGYFDPLGFCKQGDFEGFLGERLGKVVE